MPQHVTLSNGHRLDIPDGLTSAQVKARVDAMEGLINPQWKGFSNLPNASESIRNVLSYVNDPAGRIAAAGLNLNPVVGGIDLGVGGINALKSVASKYAPSLRNLPDIPSISGLAGDAAGVKPLANDAPALQRYGEAAATAVADPRSAANSIMTALRMVGSTGGGDIGSSIASYYGGPYFEKLGRWLGSVAGGVTPDTIAAGGKTAARKVFAGPQAKDVADAAERLGVQPTFGSLANIPGRLIEKGLNAMPGIGAPVQWAQQRLEEAVKAARESAAEHINQGPLPPSIDPNSIGGNMISLARSKVAEIKAGFKQRYNALTQAVDPMTLVDARPVLDAIRQASLDPTISGQQKQDLLDRANYLENMTSGHPGYNGPQYSGPLAVTPTNSQVIPLGQLNAWRSELGDDIGSMRGIDQTVQGPVRDAATAAMQDAYNQKGYGQQFSDLNSDYAQHFGPGTITDKLEAVGGKAARGKPGIYEGGMSEGQAHGFLTRNVQSPSELEPFADANSPYWRATAAQFINTLGNTDQDFRADTFGKKARGISPEVMSQFVQGSSGGPIAAAASSLRDAQLFGENATVPVSRHGLTQSIGSFAALETMGTYLADRFANLGLPAALAIPAMFMVSKGLESKAMTDAMSGRGSSTPFVDALYQGYPAAATSLALNNPDNRPPVPPPGPSPLDQLRQP